MRVKLVKNGKTPEEPVETPEIKVDPSGELCYPKIGDNVLMYANSSVLGKALIGNNVILSAGTMVVGDIIPDNSIVFGRSPELVIKVKSQEEILDRQKHLWVFKK